MKLPDVVSPDSLREDEFEGDPSRIGPLTPVTPRTITDPSALRRELERTRRVGYELNDEEMTPGIRTVAVPILDHEGHALFALAVRGPLDHMTDERISVPHRSRQGDGRGDSRGPDAMTASVASTG